jgi:hypothetical protein
LPFHIHISSHLSLAQRESLEKTYGNSREVDENIFAPVVGRDVAQAFRLVEPLDLAFEVCGGECGTHDASGDCECERVSFVYLFVGVLERNPGV